jgi:hypothetical protein
MQGADLANIVHLIFEIAVTPLFLALFYLYRAVKDIQIKLYENFVTKRELYREIEQVKQQQAFAVGAKGGQK